MLCVMKVLTHSCTMYIYQPPCKSSNSRLQNLKKTADCKIVFWNSGISANWLSIQNIEVLLVLIAVHFVISFVMIHLIHDCVKSKLKFENSLQIAQNTFFFIFTNSLNFVTMPAELKKWVIPQKSFINCKSIWTVVFRFFFCKRLHVQRFYM